MCGYQPQQALWSVSAWDLGKALISVVLLRKRWEGIYGSFTTPDSEPALGFSTWDGPLSSELFAGGFGDKMTDYEKLSHMLSRGWCLSKSHSDQTGNDINLSSSNRFYFILNLSRELNFALFSLFQNVSSFNILCGIWASFVCPSAHVELVSQKYIHYSLKTVIHNSSCVFTVNE